MSDGYPTKECIKYIRSWRILAKNTILQASCATRVLTSRENQVGRKHMTARADVSEVRFILAPLQRFSCARTPVRNLQTLSAGSVGILLSMSIKGSKFLESI